MPSKKENESVLSDWKWLPLQSSKNKKGCQRFSKYMAINPEPEND